MGSTINSLLSINLASITALLSLPSVFKDFMSLNFNLNIATSTNASVTATDYTALEETSFSSDNLTTVSSGENFTNSMSELSTTLRFTRFNNPLISYDYKCGNYLGI